MPRSERPSRLFYDSVLYNTNCMQGVSGGVGCLSFFLFFAGWRDPVYGRPVGWATELRAKHDNRGGDLWTTPTYAHDDTVLLFPWGNPFTDDP